MKSEEIDSTIKELNVEMEFQVGTKVQVRAGLSNNQTMITTVLGIIPDAYLEKDITDGFVIQHPFGLLYDQSTAFFKDIIDRLNLDKTKKYLIVSYEFFILPLSA